MMKMYIYVCYREHLALDNPSQQHIKYYIVLTFLYIKRSITQGKCQYGFLFIVLYLVADEENGWEGYKISCAKIYSLTIFV